MKSIPIAKPNFDIGNDNQLMVSDVYDSPKSNVVMTAVENIKNAIGLDVSSMLRGGIQGAKTILPLIKQFRSGGIVDKVELTSRLLTSSNAFSEGLGRALNFVGGPNNDIVKYVTENTTEIKDFVVKIGDYSRTIAGTDFTNINQVSQLINSVSTDAGLVNIIDRGAVSDIYSSLVREASALGIPNSYRSVISAIEDSAIVRKITQDVLPSILSNGDFNSLKEMAEEVGQYTLTIMDPDLIKKFTSEFSIFKNADVEDKISSFFGIRDSFKAADPDWNLYTRTDADDPLGSNEFYDLTKLTQQSDDFHEVATLGAMNSNQPEDKMFLFSQGFKLGTFDQEMRKRYPNTSIGINNNRLTDIVDPTLLNV